MKQVHFQSDATLNGEEETPVEVRAEFTYDSGEFIEDNHPFNGYNKGFEFNSIQVDFSGKDVTNLISDIELKRLMDEAASEL